MGRTIALLIILAVLTMTCQAIAESSCPASRTTVGAYRKIEVLPRYKVVGEPLTIKVVRIDQGKETPLSVSVTVEYKGVEGIRILTTKKVQTGSDGIVKYTPEKAGRYNVIASSKAAMFDVFESTVEITPGIVCGNAVCELGETANNCPADCTVCGNAICENGENKASCPEDCMICGDGVCDDAEIGASECYCAVDCLICGDGLCRAEYGEVCPTDCAWQGEESPGAENDFSQYWWVAVIAIVIVILIYRRDSIHRPKRKSEKPKKSFKARSSKSGDGVIYAQAKEKEGGIRTEIDEIVADLLDKGLSEKRIKKKLQEFGLEEDEIKTLFEEAKRLRD